MLLTTVYGSSKFDMSQSPFGRSLFSAVSSRGEAFKNVSQPCAF